MVLTSTLQKKNPISDSIREETASMIKISTSFPLEVGWGLSFHQNSFRLTKFKERKIWHMMVSKFFLPTKHFFFHMAVADILKAIFSVFF